MVLLFIERNFCIDRYFGQLVLGLKTNKAQGLFCQNKFHGVKLRDALFSLRIEKIKVIVKVLHTFAGFFERRNGTT